MQRTESSRLCWRQRCPPEMQNGRWSFLNNQVLEVKKKKTDLLAKKKKISKNKCEMNSYFCHSTLATAPFPKMSTNLK